MTSSFSEKRSSQEFVEALCNVSPECTFVSVTLGAHARRSSWVCVSVCLVTSLERLFVLKSMSRTQRATKVKKFVGFSLKPLRCRDPAPPPLYGHTCSRPFLSNPRAHARRIGAVACAVACRIMLAILFESPACHADVKLAHAPQVGTPRSLVHALY